MTLTDIENLKTLLERMRQEDPEFRVFGATLHQYRMGPTLSEPALQTFEQQQGSILPADYRFFLREGANGGAAVPSPAPIVAINAGAGPGYGLLPLDEAVRESDLSRPFPLTESTEARPVPEAEQWGDEGRFPGVLQIAYQGCSYYSWLVVNGPTYGTIWQGGEEFYPTGLSFTAWYRQWTDRLVQRALPFLANERVVEQVRVGMTKAQVVAICGEQGQQRQFDEKYAFLRFPHLATVFELDRDDIVTRLIRHAI